jgi:hypothetical protein
MDIPRPVLPHPPSPPVPIPPPADHPALTFLGWYPNAPQQSSAYDAGMRTSLLLLLRREERLSQEEIIAELTRATGAEPDPASVGRVLQRLEDEGLVIGSVEEGTREFRLSDGS